MGKPGRVDGQRKFYSRVLINNEEVSAEPRAPPHYTLALPPRYVWETQCLCVRRQTTSLSTLAYMWEEGGRGTFHGQWYSRGCETVLGETGDPCELFMVDQCDDNPLGAVLGKVNVSTWLADVCVGCDELCH